LSNQTHLKILINPKNRIAVLGGSFDPPTLGHLKIAEYLVDCMKFDEVWVIPAYTHTFEKDLSEFHHRINMCRLIFRDKRFIVSDFQKTRKCDSSTLNLFRLLEKEYPNNDFYMTIGTDNANNIHKWINYKQVITDIKFVVIERRNQELQNNIKWCLNPPHIYIKSFDIDEISSTLTRNAIKKREYPHKFTSNYILHYIEENNLYK